MNEKYQYNICNNYSRKIFELQCMALERHIPKLVLIEDIEDVDGSQIRRYQHVNGQIIIQNDYPIGAVFIDSDFELESYF